MGSVGKSSINNTNTFNKTELRNIEDFGRYSEYGEQLAMMNEGSKVYQIEYNGQRAFADASDAIYKGELYISSIASTGKGAGTELLARLAEKAYKDKLTLSWVADEDGAMRYYEKINVKKYGKVEQGTTGTSYEVKGEQLKKFAEDLRKRRKSNGFRR